MLAKVRGQLTARGVKSRVVDRHSGLVGPPEVKQCDPPLEAWRSGDNATRHGYATIYVCQSERQARGASVTGPSAPRQP